MKSKIDCLPRKIFTDEYLQIAPWEEFKDLQLNYVIDNMKVGQGKLFPAKRSTDMIKSPQTVCRMPLSCIALK